MATATIGIGSNLGDRHAHIQHAFQSLATLPDTRVIATSSVYETAPVGPVEQGMFLNAAAALETRLPPLELLAGLQRIEAAAGRAGKEDRVRWGPRELDMDILFYDHLTLTLSGLVIPHPQLHKRWFVLKPLADVAPDFIHPELGKSITELLYDVEHRCDLR